MKKLKFMLTGMSALTAAAAAQTPSDPLTAEDAARKFGAREIVQNISLSPDGKAIAMLVPTGTRGTSLTIINLAGTPQTKSILTTDGSPDRLSYCRWATSARLICGLLFIQRETGEPIGYTRLIALKADGSDGAKVKMLSVRNRDTSLGVSYDGGNVIDWLSDGNGAVLMTRDYVPERSTGAMLAQRRSGLGVDRVDTATAARTMVEQPRDTATEYISDGRGVVRIMGLRAVGDTGYQGNRIAYSYRKQDSREWLPLSVVETVNGGLSTGFDPYAVDPDLNVAYGFEEQDGRTALFKVALDGSLKRELVYDRPDVDVDQLIRIGRQRRVVGVGYATDNRKTAFFDPKLKAFAASLSKALPDQPLVSFVDASADESKLLLWAGSDRDPGRFYLFDKATKGLAEVLPVRPPLAGVPLSTVKAIAFPAADGTMIPGYLTLPPGSDGKNLPAIVLPHGGPDARDEWTFDWLPQYFANRGYAVLQPNYRGSTGYGASFFQKNGFQSWRTAIGDVDDGGRWLVKQGIARADKMAVVGWSYGGYAALQSAVLDPALFKAIVAVAPVTDLPLMVERRKNYSDYKRLVAQLGTGPNAVQGSPALNAARIKLPVLLFHGDLDLNVAIEQSRVMAAKLKDAGGKVELVEYKGLDHQLEDDGVRSDLLAKSDAFLRAAMGL